jgi:hypothetical protein
MATANFTTKPPMLDGRCLEMGYKELEIFGSIVSRNAPDVMLGPKGPSVDGTCSNWGRNAGGDEMESFGQRHRSKQTVSRDSS